ncbi:hypothetical protein [Bifidobacterium sp. SO1]|uniref:hypothetical protein n=1 Tax=Bifidobacterium sp. SO1 TaxID=2809029 RepID=UPI001BDBF662|nr:hypothetical protein [Bifidobacterium sp. SO1]MBT1162767.1 hypothetical protein [Bifidobacterium sp. SO1]
MSPTTGDTSVLTPLDEQDEVSADVSDFVIDGDVTQSDSEGILVFDRFTSGLPLLMERPSRYTNRLQGAAFSMFRPPADDKNGGLENRILWSPSIAFPFFLLFGDEKFKDQDVLKYPFLHVPSNHQPTDDTDLTVYALTLYALYTATGLLGETNDGAILTYGLEDPFEVTDADAWDAADDWARTVTPLLSDLNKARLLGFALKDVEHEAAALNVLFYLWGESRPQNELIDAGRQAADLLAGEYDVFLDQEFKPFQEH